MLAAIVPTTLITLVGVIGLVIARRGMDIALGVMILAFSGLAITGIILVQIFVRRGESLARLQNDFVSSVSHELRTPLTAIRMFVETLAMGRLRDDPAETQRCLDLLAGEVARLETLVERVLELARLEAGKQVFDQRATRVDDIVKGALAAFETMRLARGGAVVDVTVNVDPTLLVDVDRAALEQALLNLLVNAYKYTGEDKRIEIAAALHTTRKVELVVADNGPGIPKQDRRVIFDRFERGSADKKTVEGTGMGLAVVDLIVRAHHGRVVVDTTVPSGARFKILLPRSRATEPAAAPSASVSSAIVGRT